jgi:hypothetical protein
MEPGAYFQESRHPATTSQAAFGRFRQAAHDLQESAFARPVSTHDADSLATTNLKRNIAKRPQRFGIVFTHREPASSALP